MPLFGSDKQRRVRPDYNDPLLDDPARLRAGGACYGTCGPRR